MHEVLIWRLLNLYILFLFINLLRIQFFWVVFMLFLYAPHDIEVNVHIVFLYAFLLSTTFLDIVSFDTCSFIGFWVILIESRIILRLIIWFLNSILFSNKLLLLFFLPKFFNYWGFWSLIGFNLLKLRKFLKEILFHVSEKALLFVIIFIWKLFKT